MSAITYAEPVLTEHASSIKMPERETVSVIIPCYNEEQFIGAALNNLAHQYPFESYEIIVVDGMSEDSTREMVRQFMQLNPELSISLIENPQRTIPHALNIGISVARGQIIARMDAHASPSSGYINRCVEVLRSNDVAIVGMPCRVQPGGSTRLARAIALAVSHPFGIGDAKYRLEHSNRPQELVDTVAFACFRKSLWARLGGYNEKLLTNEDYDFNYRTRLTGGLVVLDRSEYCDYFARPSLSKLSSQYLRYGGWKARMILKHPRSLKVRHLVAPAFVASLVLLAAVGLLQPLAWNLLIVELGLYLFAAAAFSLQAAIKRGAGLTVAMLMAPVFLTIHFSWGASFLLGLIRQPRKG